MSPGGGPPSPSYLAAHDPNIATSSAPTALNSSATTWLGPKAIITSCWRGP